MSSSEIVTPGQRLRNRATARGASSIPDSPNPIASEPSAPRRDLGRAPIEGLGSLQQLQSVRKQQLPGRRQPGTVPAAAEQHRADPALQHLDLLGQRGLTGRQLLGRGPEVPQPGDRDERPEQTEIHNPRIWNRPNRYWTS